ncbi:MAG: CpsD/CapB family tyrosine-protein kinase [Anaerolineales bacterium]|nr:CpsD/CapB family tyrosine-protein kinase [Anaerolineales bacterium]
MSSQIRANLVTVSDPRSAAAEAYRALRTNLSFSSLDDPIRTLVVTTPAPQDNKSMVIANLAVIMAQGGNRTLLVDCDLRRPGLHEIFGVDNSRGLTTMMLEEDAMSDPPVLATEIENLLLLPSGPLPPNPADLLGSRRMDLVIERLVEGTDIVLLDAPPVMAVTDAAVLGSKVDGVLLVIRAGSTRREHAERAKELLEKVNIRIVGAVLDNAPADALMGAYYG